MGTMMLLAACSVGSNSQNTAETRDPLAIAQAAADNLRNVETFRMEIEQTGAPHFIGVDIGDGVIEATLRRGIGQWEAPDLMLAEIDLIAAGLPVGVEIFSQSENQWFRGLFTANRWVNAPFAEGFNPAVILGEDTGINAVLAMLDEIEFIGEESLEDGSDVYHLRGVTNGDIVSTIVGGWILFPERVIADVFIERETNQILRLILVEPGTETEEDPVPSTWRIDVFDINAESEIVPPDA
ncbi:MAG: LppX_LprAFG lipoprotein [Chloroflexi bacterium]|nr:MAG: LppX_LprAFG lipoprotein [Chloroflexota bacterium]